MLRLRHRIAGLSMLCCIRHLPRFPEVSGQSTGHQESCANQAYCLRLPREII